MQAAFWTAVIIVCFIVELCTTALVSIWFSLGGIGAFIAAMLGASFPVSLLVFVLISAISLLFTRKFVKKFMNVPNQPTNYELVIGQTAEVIEDIDSLKGTGRVKLDGVDWSALSEDNIHISAGESVTVKDIKSTKLIVSPIKLNEMR